MTQLLSRAHLLMAQQRYELAEEVLGQELAQDPNSAMAHSLLAICMLQDRDRIKDATREAEQGIHLAPDSAYSFFVHAQVMRQRNQFDEGLASIDRAIALEPDDPAFYAVRAAFLGQKNDWRACLEAAETGLQYDPDDEACRAFRSLSLERLGRVQDAVSEAQLAIRRDPDSATAHASLGWAHLQNGDYRQAQVAFREALRLEPSNEFARSGMVQALNSNSVIFRFFMSIFNWMSRLDNRVQWGLIIGLWLGIQFLDDIAAQFPWFSPYVLPLIMFYLLFVMMSWIATPLFNTFLRFHPFGKHLLTRKEKWASNLTGAAILMGAGLFVLTLLITGEVVFSLIPLLLSIYLTIPISVAFQTEPGWPSWVAAGCLVLFAGLYLTFNATFFLPIAPKGFALSVMQIYQYGILGYCFFGNYLKNVSPRI